MENSITAVDLIKMENSMTAVDLIKETVSYYKTHKRAKDHYGCAYKTSRGSMCAVGRCMNVQGLMSYGKYRGDADTLFDYIKKEHNNPLSYFKQKYHKFITPDYYELWMDLQYLHDKDENWEERVNKRGNVLSSHGEKVVEELIFDYA